MSAGTKYILQGYWGPRRETAAACGARFWSLLEALRPIDPLFGDWKFIGRSRFLPMPGEPGERLTRLIEATVVRDDYEDPDPEFGYRFGASARAGKSTSLTMMVHAGCYVPKAQFLANSVDLEMAPLNAENVPLITFPICRAVLLAIAAAWDTTWCAAYPLEVTELWPHPQPNARLGWITYLSPRFAPLVTPPPSVISEKTSNGGILMSAVADRFEITNPAHMAAAQVIQDSLAAFNALPWPPDA